MRKNNCIIEFIDATDQTPEEFYPKPARQVLPQWYKDLPSYKDNKKQAYMDERGYASSTVKKCMPVYDALTSGYIIFSNMDIQISGSKYNKNYRWPVSGAINSHANWQLGSFSDVRENDDIPKWKNPWAIKTNPGYSCLFVNPMNREKSPIKFFEGVVDTDRYTAPVNFPFYLQDFSWEGIIPAGTPLIQVIPFRRETYTHKISLNKDFKVSPIDKVNSLIDVIFFNGYKKHMWSRKEYE